jgi:AcrR family transcriptional regulator
MARVASPRRIGSEDSGTRSRLLDAAGRLMQEQGYAAVTSRRVASEAGLKPQLVHYYFRTMDDLFVELFRRGAEVNIRRFEQELAEDGSLANLWRLNSDRRGTALTLEFVALANHRKAVRAEITRFAERFRAAQVEAMRKALADADIHEEQLPPIVGLLLMTGLSQVLTIESSLGVTAGHDTTVAFVEQALAELEARAPARRGQRRQ